MKNDTGIYYTYVFKWFNFSTLIVLPYFVFPYPFVQIFCLQLVAGASALSDSEVNPIIPFGNQTGGNKKQFRAIERYTFFPTEDKNTLNMAYMPNTYHKWHRRRSCKRELSMRVRM